MFPADPIGIGMMLEPLGLAAGPVVPTREWRELYAALDCVAVAAIHPFYTASLREFASAGRPVVASIDPGTAVPQILDESGGGLAVAPDDAVAFTEAIRAMVAEPERGRRLGTLGRAWVEANASPAAVGAAYDQLVRSLIPKRA